MVNQNHVLWHGKTFAQLTGSKGKSSQNRKRFKQKWRNYELAIGIARKEDRIRVVTFLHVNVIGEEALDVYNAITWDYPKATKSKWIKFWSNSKFFVSPERIPSKRVFFYHEVSKVVSPLINMPQPRETWQFIENLKTRYWIRDRIVFAVTDSHVRERMSRVPDLMLNI